MQGRGSIALVTGANRGIGRALVESLLAHGAARVYATARHARDFDALAWLDRKRIATLALDVTDAASLARTAEGAQDVNLLFNPDDGGDSPLSLEPGVSRQCAA